MKKRTKIILITIVSIVALVFVFAKAKRISPLSWGHPEVNQSMFSDLAINGYDAVSYFTEGKALPGNDKHAYEWNNAKWIFSSEENKNLFAARPEKYAPKYGGYCAFAVSKGFTANSDPNSFEIIGDKLYLFAEDGIKADWNKNQEVNLQQSEKYWK